MDDVLREVWVWCFCVPASRVNSVYHVLGTGLHLHMYDAKCSI